MDVGCSQLSIQKVKSKKRNRNRNAMKNTNMKIKQSEWESLMELV
jgi:hypothetical protein